MVLHATAQKAADREASYLKGQGVRPTYFGGIMWSLPKRQFQALYKVVGSIEETYELRPDMINWPPQANGEPFDQPPPHIMRLWIAEVDACEIEVDQKLVKYFEEKIDRKFKADMRRGMMISSRALQHLARKVIDGTLDPKTQSQILSLGQAVNYGVGNYAQLLKAQSPGQTQIAPQINNFFAPPPRPKMLKAGKKAKQLIEAEFSEVPSGGAG